MSHTRIKCTALFLVMLMVACVGFPQKGFSEDKRAGFYAGPLSVAAETVVETVAEKPKQTPESTAQEAEEKMQKHQNLMKRNEIPSSDTNEEHPLSPAFSSI